MPQSQISDDLIHLPAANPGWRESYYFDFYDPVLGIGMWHSVGKRPYKGHSGYALGAWGSHTLAGIGRDHFSQHTEEHRVGGMHYECIEPLKKWRTTFDGELGIPLLQPRLDVRCMLPEGQAEMQRVPVRFDLTFTGISPAYTYKDLPVWKPLFSGHLDQVGRTTGTLTIADTTYEIDAVGGRDRSWGTRDWAYPRMWRFISVAGDGFNLMLWYTEADHGVSMVDGFVQEGGDFLEVVGYQETVQTDPAPGKAIPRSLNFEALTVDGRSFRVDGEVLQVMPVVFEKQQDGKPVTSWNDRALVRYRLPNGSSAYGNIEFGERILSGAPKAPA
jgi:hypothetical protein